MSKLLIVRFCSQISRPLITMKFMPGLFCFYLLRNPRRPGFCRLLYLPTHVLIDGCDYRPVSIVINIVSFERCFLGLLPFALILDPRGGVLSILEIFVSQRTQMYMVRCYG